MSTPPSQTPTARRVSARTDTAEVPVAWPILIIDRDDHFVHVLAEEDLDTHHEGPDPSGPLIAGIAGEPAPAVPVDIFDRDGRRLRPIVGADFGFLGVEATAVLASTDVLMERLDRALQWALEQLDESDLQVAPVPDRPRGDYGDYLDELREVFIAVTNNGSAWHNFVHVIT
jgi:hypothetical protein